MEGGAQRNVIVIGTLGVGKSTVMNRMAGGEQFVVSNGAMGCTQKVSSYTNSNIR